MRRQFLTRMAAMAASAIAAPYSFAQSSYPDKPIRILIGLAPGGSTDPMIRLIQPKLTELLGQPIIIENKPGGGTSIAASMVTGAPSDGYTLLFTAASTHVIHSIGIPRITYDPIKDFTPIATVSRAGWVMVVHESVPAKTIPEFVAYCKANPNKVSYASGGIGNANHLNFERFNHAMGIKTVHVPYKAGNSALPDIMSGRVQAYFTGVPTVQAGITSGALRPLAYSAARQGEVPPHMTFTAAGLPEFENVSSTTCLLGPGNLPSAITAKLAGAIEKTLALPEIKAAMVAQQQYSYYTAPKEFAESLRFDYEKYKQVMKEANIKLEG